MCFTCIWTFWIVYSFVSFSLFSFPLLFLWKFRNEVHLVLNLSLYFIYFIPFSLYFICPFFFFRFLSRPFLSFFLYAFNCPLKVFKFSGNLSGNLSDNLAITFRCKRSPGEVLDLFDSNKKNSMKKTKRLLTLALGYHVVLRFG